MSLGTVNPFLFSKLVGITDKRVKRIRNFRWIESELRKGKKNLSRTSTDILNFLYDE